jgi:hypothetical protein
MGRKKILKTEEVIIESLPGLGVVDSTRQLHCCADPEPEIESHPTIIEIEQPIKLQLTNPEHMDSDTDTLIVANKRRSLTDKTKEALKKGREKLAEKWINDRIRNDELKDKYAIKKANKLIKQKMKLKKQMNAEDLDSEDEEPIKLIQPKKPKKQQIIVLPIESDDEDEIIIKKEKKSIKKLIPIEIEPIKSKPSIVFY